MENKQNSNKNIHVENIDMTEFQTNYLTLRIGEEIPQLQVKEIKKLTNPNSSNNLPGVDYKFLIVCVSDCVLTVNSWVFWNTLKRVIKEHGEIPKILSLKHPAEKVYEISVVE